MITTGRSAAARRPQPGAPAAVAEGAPDYVLLLVTAALLGIGLLMVFSASSVEAGVVYRDPFYFLKRQAAWSVLGTVALVFFARFDYWRLKRVAPAVVAVTLVLLFAVLVPHIGHKVAGARRWLGFGPLQFQPSEMAKLTLVVFFSAWLADRRDSLRRFRRGLLPYLIWVGVAGALILAEPDLGTAGALVATAAILVFVAGVPVGQLIGTGLLSLPLLAYVVMGSAYRRQRFFAFLNPQADPLGSGYHITQALYALGSGGLFGRGFGLSLQKYFYLPEQHTDFIFAILGEELGFLGAAIVLVLFFVLIWRGFRIAVKAPDRFGALLAAGVTAMLAVQVVINVGVVTSVLPITGITLPLISFGGSSLVFSLAAIGMLANISRFSRA